MPDAPPGLSELPVPTVRPGPPEIPLWAPWVRRNALGQGYFHVTLWATHRVVRLPPEDHPAESPDQGVVEAEEVEAQERVAEEEGEERPAAVSARAVAAGAEEPVEAQAPEASASSAAGPTASVAALQDRNPRLQCV